MGLSTKMSGVGLSIYAVTDEQVTTGMPNANVSEQSIVSGLTLPDSVV